MHVQRNIAEGRLTTQDTEPPTPEDFSEFKLTTDKKAKSPTPNTLGQSDRGKNTKNRE